VKVITEDDLPNMLRVERFELCLAALPEFAEAMLM
jgi:hypothetical protein